MHTDAWVRVAPRHRPIHKRGADAVVDREKGAEMSTERFGKYVLLGRLGAGGMGLVHLARDDDGRIVAVKMMHDSVAVQDFGHLRFEREVVALSRVRSPHVALFVDADLIGPKPYLVTEYVQGRSLREVVDERGPLGAADLVRIGLGIARGIEAIHRAGVVHRDIKPSNIMIADGEPVIIDLGVALLADHTRITKELVGTPEYMAPEIFHGARPDEKADVFAWGAVLVFAATGRSCFAADSNAAVLHRVLYDKPDLAGVPAGLRDVVDRALVKDPKQRLTLRSLCDELARLRPPPIALFQDAYEDAVARGEHGRAEGIAFGIHAIAAADQDRILAARSLLDQAHAARHSGAFERAEVLFEQAREAAVAVGARRDEGWALDGIGVCQNHREAYGPAERSFTSALAIAEEVGDSELHAWNLSNLAGFARRRNDLPAAVRLYGEARKVAHDHDHQQIEMYALHDMGRCLREQREFESAEDAFDRARRMAETIGYPHDAGWAWYDVAECAYARGDRERAQRNYENALRISVQVADKVMQGWSLCKLAKCLTDAGKKDRAAERYRQAERLASFLGDDPMRTYAAERLKRLGPA